MPRGAPCRERNDAVTIPEPPPGTHRVLIVRRAVDRLYAAEAAVDRARALLERRVQRRNQAARELAQLVDHPHPKSLMTKAA
jgi:hypothetical protein